jgi:molecular chaperone GrpE
MTISRKDLKEKEALYVDAVSDVISALLPVIDNVERALQAITADSSAQSLKDGR